MLKRLFFLGMLLSAYVTAQQTTLTSLGPNGGVITQLTGSLNDDIVFSVVRGNGLYRSTDGGEHWNIVTTINFNFQNLTIGQISIHPVSSDTVLMATAVGLYRSNDKGISWSSPSSFPSPTHCVEYVPANPSILFGSDENGVLRSNDAGKTWFPLKDNVYFGNRSVYNISIHPADITNIRVLVSTGFSDTTALFYSPDGGKNWKPFNKGLPQGAARRIYAVEIDSTGLGKTDFRALIGTADGIYGTQTNPGDSVWQTLKSNGLPIAGVITGGILVYDRFDQTVLPNGEHKFSFYLTSNGSEYDGKPMPTTEKNGVFKIDSKSGSIFSAGPFSPPIKQVFNGNNDIYSIFSPFRKDKAKIYLGTSAGIYVSNDSGTTWQQKNDGINQTAIRNCVSMQQSSVLKPVFAATYGGGVLRSNDAGVTWSAVNNGVTSPFITGLAVDRKRNYLYAGSVYSLYRSTNFGTKWDQIFTVDSTVVLDQQKYATRNNDMTIRVSAKNPDFILLHTKAYGLRLSTDGGSSWKLVQTPFFSDTIYVPEHFEFDPIDSLTIYFANYGLHKSTNLGQTWVDISGNLPTSVSLQSASGPQNISTISPTINPKNNKEILLPTVFNQLAGYPFRIFKTTNGGSSWDSLLVPAYDVIYNPFDTQSMISSGPYGIFGSSDGGKTWGVFSNPQIPYKYLLINEHASNQNIFFIGSENGAHRLDFNGTSHLLVDSGSVDFGSLFIGSDSVRMITMSNQTGTRKVVVQFVSLSDSLLFRYSGPRQFDVMPGAEVQIPVRFLSLVPGSHSATLAFVTNDDLLTNVQFALTGHTFTRNVVNKFTYDFGSVAVGKDSILDISIDNNEGVKSFQLTYLGKLGDTASFEYVSPVSVTVESGTAKMVSIRFKALSAGEEVAYFKFATNDPLFDSIVIRFKGLGVARNFMARKILIDSAVSSSSVSGLSLSEYFKALSLSLRRADISVQFQKNGSYSGYNAIVYTGAPQASNVDSLQRYVSNGGILVLLGDGWSQTNKLSTAFLDDSGWVKKFNTKTGIRFNSNLLVDSLDLGSLNGGIVIVKPPTANLLTNNVDSVITFLPASLTIDTTLRYVEPLLTARSSSIYSISETDTFPVKVSGAVVAAAAKIGKGRVIAISDQDVWWNGIPDDTTNMFGVFSGKNLQFALNIFGLVDNLAALLEPTPQEAYEMLSIPYAFSDSSVTTLFKDLGKPNKLLWRMFGKYNQKTGYAEFPDDFTSIRRGEGYWLIAKNPVNMNLGTTTVQGTEGDFQIVLHSGYNMIGNPFPYKVSWQNSFRADSVERVLWTYNNGTYDSVTQNMEPFHGYWVKNRGVLPKIIRINSLLISDSSSIAKNEQQHVVLDPNEWKLQLTARTSTSIDAMNFVGVLNASADGFDDNDFSKPPTAPSNFVSISMNNEGQKLAADFRAFNPEGNYWDFDLSSSETNIPVSISISSFGAITPGFKIYLLDTKQERLYDVSNSSFYSFAMGKNEHVRPFRLIVGNRQYIEQHANGIPVIPIEYSLSQNYPNPFNPVTTIQYSVSHSGIVTLEIFNVLGQKVRTLVAGFQPIGSYIEQWDGKDVYGKGMASGIYYYRIRINEFSSVKKMTFIK